MNSFGYNSTHSINPQASTVFSRLKDSSAVIIAAHCKPGKVELSDQDDNLIGTIGAHSYIVNGTNSYYLSQGDNGISPNELSDLNFVLYLGCRSGVDCEFWGTAYNLVDETVKGGAHYAMGAKEIIYSDEINFFCMNSYCF